MTAFQGVNGGQIGSLTAAIQPLTQAAGKALKQCVQGVPNNNVVLASSL